ncbi:hypothetical protein L5515_005888 [Caenorhabditis briggsae]|uniref:Uncharacterized protein n=1 Tax=Caenorhabditis briggsae TaxID=6238 RepID=A0AAE9JI10_CAEBR|nr:hypothetical protein L5515_005888 [Caenorhabditis briggsae]
MPKTIFKDFRRRRKLKNVKANSTTNYYRQESAYGRNRENSDFWDEEFYRTSREESGAFNNTERSEYSSSEEWTRKISHARDDVLQFLAASCLSRLSQQEYERFLSAHDFGFERDVEELWNYNRNKFSVLYFCNMCGRRMMQSDNCCGEIVKFVRIGVLSQLKELVQEHISSILAIREKYQDYCLLMELVFLVTASEALFGNKSISVDYQRSTRRDKQDKIGSVFLYNIRSLLSQVQLPSNMGNIHKLRNGTDKISYFQLVLGLCAICTDCWSPEARLVIVSLSLITNRMYTIGTTDSEFDEILTDCCRWFLRKASISYFSCKAHELLFHLPYVSRTFGNTAPLSTFSFEASYQYILKGFSTKITRGFCETVCSRVLIANSVKREMKKRSENNPGPRLRKFFSSTSGYISVSSSCRNLVTSKKFESVIELPSRRTFLMSQLITAGQASKFTSTDFLEHAKGLYRVTFKKLASMDEYFAVYTASTYSSLGYRPFGGSFFTQTAKFVCDGFGQEFTEDLEASCTCAAREVLINLIDRIRKELKKLNYDSTTILHQLNYVIAQEADDIDRSLLDSTGPPIQRLLCLS